MQFKNVAIESIAYELAPEVWTSEAIEMQLQPMYERLKLQAGRLELMTGIKERRFWNPGTKPSGAAAAAGLKVLEKSRVKKDAIDLLIHCSVSRDRLEPSTAAYVHGLLDLSAHAQIFDVSNACLGFLNALSVGGGMIDSGQIKTALIVSGENGRPLVEHTIKQLIEGTHSRNEIKPYFANLTIGSGAVATILTRKDLVKHDCLKLVSGIVETDTSAINLCEGDSLRMDAFDMQTDSEGLLHAGIEVAKRAWKKFEIKTGWNTHVVNRFICHQVGRRHQLQFFEALGLDIKKDFSTFEHFGNMGSASLPVTIAKALENRILKKGDKLGLLGIGSGISCMMIALQY